METISCKKCGSYDKVKAGFVHHIQRYKCKNCQSFYLPGTLKQPDSIKQSSTVELYLEGMSIRGISRYLHVSHVTIMKWLKVMAIRLKPLLPLEATHIEIDELYLYIKKKKKKRWLWLAVCRETKRILGFQVGGRGKVTLGKLFYKIEPIENKKYYTDDHAPYKNVLPKEKHSCKPGLTNTIEGINCSIRRYLARFHRRSTCYSKS